MRYLLAFAYNMHDSSVSIADRERVLLVLEAERYFGEKKKRCTHEEMERLVAVALDHCQIEIGDVEAVACTAYYNEHLAEEDRNCSWLAERPISLLGRSFEALVVNHHLAHAAMIHAFPGAREAVIDVCDGGGDFGDTHRVYRCSGGRLEQLPNQPIHDAFSSRFYDVMSRYLYRRLMCEGKLMALASLGTPRPDIVDFIRAHLSMFHAAKPEVSFAEIARRYPVSDYRRSRTAFDLAAAAQHVFEDLRVESVRALPEDAPDVMLAGGATLNIQANARVRASLGPKRRLLLPPCCDDTGQSLGALLYLGHERMQLPITVSMPFVGYSDAIDSTHHGHRRDEEEASDALVDFLAGGGIVFLHRGPSEIGPRALGHRSILALPSRRSYDIINHLIKQREFYRPLAPLVPEEAVSSWFEWDSESKYMLYAAPVTDRTRLEAPGICHYDRSARLQTIDRRDDPFLHRILTSVGQATGCPLLINTSLNGRGVPIYSRIDKTRAFARETLELGVRVFYRGQLEA